MKYQKHRSHWLIISILFKEKNLQELKRCVSSIQAFGSICYGAYVTVTKRFKETAIDRGSSEGKAAVLTICFCFLEPLVRRRFDTTNTRFTMKTIGDNLRVTMSGEKFSDFQARAHAHNRVNERDSTRMRSHLNAARTICRVYPTKRKYLSRFP